MGVALGYNARMRTEPEHLPISLSDAVTALAKRLAGEVSSGEILHQNTQALLESLQECQEAVALGSPDAPSLLRSLQLEMDYRSRCRTLLDKIRSAILAE